ncbi:gamma-glutamyltransferase [bacterium]|jgi:gamma-glutamyltranspeptidase / glutathione hydrolase|nr:gamma-glutamyltransferase [bacterium]
MIFKYLSITLITITTLTSTLSATPIQGSLSRFHPVTSQYGMVASQEAIASQEGLKVLQEGGNAIDAAVTVGFVLAVTLPRAGNLGGGGFMLVHIASENKTIALDYREVAPLQSQRNMYLSETREFDPYQSRFTYKAAGVPGTVAGLFMALDKYGTISHKRALAPALSLAKKGITVTPSLHKSLVRAKKHLGNDTASKKVFYPEGAIPKVGSLLKQTDLAWSLQELITHKDHAFYRGSIGKKLIAAMESNKGIMEQRDLNLYKPKLRAPIKGVYRGHTILSMPSPSSGGTLLVQMLNILTPYPIQDWGHNSSKTMHVMAETMKIAYADRAQYLGDPDYSNIPEKGLTSHAYASVRRKLINPRKTTPSKTIQHGLPYPYESNETTHFSIVDQWGNAVSNTYTLNFSYGSGKMIPGTGILLNNEMDDFSAKPGEPNAYGLIGGRVNEIAPRKRMLSSMTPTIVMKNDEVFLVTGTPGGSRIITTTLQIIMNIIDHKMNVAEATASPRFHHQWLPDELRIESGFNPDTLELLKQKGHSPVLKQAMGSTQSIIRRLNPTSKTGVTLSGASDPRKSGSLTIGH